MFNFKKIEKEKGVSIFLSLLITTVFLSVGIGLATMFQEQKEVTKDVLAAIQSRAAAETGIEHAMYESLDPSHIHPTHFTVSGELVKFPETPKGEYVADYYSFCHESYVSSTGSYKGSRVRRTIDTGDSNVEIIPKDSFESCESLVASYPQWTCPASIGTDEEGVNRHFWDWQGTCVETELGIAEGIGRAMTDDGRICGPEGEYAEWAYCRMYR